MLNSIKNFFSAAQQASVAEINPENLKAKFTPDVGFLEQYAEMLVFVPDHYMKGHTKHSSLVHENSFRLCVARTKYTYSGWENDNGAVFIREDYYPQKETWRGRRPGDPAPVQGELYILPVEVIKKLDMERENTLQFKRRRVPLEIHYSELRERPWFRESARFNDGMLSKTEKSLKNPEEAEIVKVAMPPFTIPGAWMYCGVPEVWNKKVRAEWPDDPTQFPDISYKPVNLFKTRDNEYYYHHTRVPITK